jgi:hypothetical protein
LARSLAKAQPSAKIGQQEGYHPMSRIVTGMNLSKVLATAIASLFLPA